MSKIKLREMEAQCGNYTAADLESPVWHLAKLRSWAKRAVPHLREIDRLRDNELGLLEEPMTDEHAEIKALLAEIEDKEREG